MDKEFTVKNEVRLKDLVNWAKILVDMGKDIRIKRMDNPLDDDLIEKITDMADFLMDEIGRRYYFFQTDTSPVKFEKESDKEIEY